MRSVVLAAVIAALSGGVDAAAQRPPANCEARTSRDTFTGATVSSLTLVLSGSRGKVPISTAVTATRRAGGSGEPSVRFDFDLTLFYGLPNFQPPHLAFLVDKKTREEVSLEFKVPSSVPLEGAKRVSMPALPADVRRLADAKTAEGRLFGLDFALTPAQISCVRQFVAGWR